MEQAVSTTLWHRFIKNHHVLHLSYCVYTYFNFSGLHLQMLTFPIFSKFVPKVYIIILNMYVIMFLYTPCLTFLVFREISLTYKQGGPGTDLIPWI